ncbi:MAG: hypothetical protein ABI780_08925 [Ardenticatenales bacterium]
MTPARLACVDANLYGSAAAATGDEAASYELVATAATAATAATETRRTSNRREAERIVEHLGINWSLLIMQVVYWLVLPSVIVVPIAWLFVRHSQTRRLVAMEARLAQIESSLSLIEQHLAILVEQGRHRSDG